MVLLFEMSKLHMGAIYCAKLKGVSFLWNYV
jgi:hypothetical protein